MVTNGKTYYNQLLLVTATCTCLQQFTHELSHLRSGKVLQVHCRFLPDLTTTEYPSQNIRLLCSNVLSVEQLRAWFKLIPPPYTAGSTQHTSLETLLKKIVIQNTPGTAEAKQILGGEQFISPLYPPPLSCMDIPYFIPQRHT